MSDYAASRSAHDAHHPVARKTSLATVGWIVLASVLCGIGLFLLSYWLLSFAWWAFAGTAFVIVGFLIFLKTWTGPESA